MKRWINTKVTFEWDGEQYVETSAEGYNYEGEMALCTFSPYSGYGGGGGGGAGGNGGVVVLVTSQLSKPLLDSGKVDFTVQAGERGGYGNGGSGSSWAGWGNNGGPGSSATRAWDGSIIKIIM